MTAGSDPMDSDPLDSSLLARGDTEPPSRPKDGGLVTRVRVIRGAERGQVQVFARPVVTLGHDRSNDFTLFDPSVAERHVRVERLPDGVLRLSTLHTEPASVVAGDHTWELGGRGRRARREVELFESAHVRVGDTVLELAVVPAERERVTPKKGVASPPKPTGHTATRHKERSQDHVVHTVRDSPDRFAASLAPGVPHRLDVLFQLTRQLNALTRLEDILDLVSRSAFEMFPLASFFAIVIPQDLAGSSYAGVAPSGILFKRARAAAGPSDPVLSQTIVRRVVDQRQSVLFVRDPEGKGGLGETSRSILQAKITACMAAPLSSQHRIMGVMVVDSRGGGGLFTHEDLDFFVVLASSVAFAMERARLTRNIYEMFEAFVGASVAAIEARDPSTAGHSERVAYYALLLAEGVNRVISGPLGPIHFSQDQLTELRYAALLHDFGKIGVAENVLQKPSRLGPDVQRVVEQRIALYKQVASAELRAALLARLREEGRPPTQADEDELAREVQAVRARADDYLVLVRRLQRAGERPRDSDVRVVQEMAEITSSDGDGGEHRLLTPSEAADLLIPAGTLNDLERLHLQAHPGLTESYLSRIPWSHDLQGVPTIAGRHHEKLDGSGYPQGLKGGDLSPQVRILTIADIFDALTAVDRPYRRAWSAAQASDLLAREAADGKLDAALVDFFTHQIVPSVEPNLRGSLPPAGNDGVAGVAGVDASAVISEALDAVHEGHDHAPTGA